MCAAWDSGNSISRVSRTLAMERFTLQFRAEGFKQTNAPQFARRALLLRVRWLFEASQDAEGETEIVDGRYMSNHDERVCSANRVLDCGPR
jgi:hypothetical protein